MINDPYDAPVFFAAGRSFSRIVLEDFFHYEFFQEDNVPALGPCLLACNHVSFLDPPAVANGIERNCHCLARRTLFGKGLWKWLFERFLTIPVDLNGGANEITTIRSVLHVLEDGQAVLIFPEGTRSKNGEIQEAKRGMGLIAALAQVPVVPVRIFGAFEAMGRDRTQFFHPVRVVYGRPLRPADYDPGKGVKDRYEQISRRVMDAISSIREPHSAPQESLSPCHNFSQQKDS